MSEDLRKITVFCEHCRNRVSYTVKERTVKEKVDGVAISYVEEYAICNECKEELYVGNIHDRNLEKFNQACREEKIK